MEVITQRRFPQFAVEVSHAAHAGEARRAALQAAESLGMDEGACGSVAIAVTELATNLVKHTQGGKIICESLASNGASALRVLSIDKGPGIRDAAAALEDGYSTSGTSGNGLGAVRRLSSHFDIYSLPDRGTCVLAEFWTTKNMGSGSAVELGAVSLPVHGESVCGDGWGIKTMAESTTLMVVDGLGHGELAAEAAREAERVLAQTDSSSPASIVRDCHDALKKTRGAAVAIAKLPHEKGPLSFAGLGNISATLISGQGRRGIASHNGTAGHQLHRLQEFTLPWNGGSALIMHSDGLTTRWDLESYPGLGNRHPSVIAGTLYRDFARERDDVTVLVAKNLA